MNRPPPHASTVAPGGTIGILGGGQLGRMIAIAATQLGFRTHVFCHAVDDPAAQVAAAVTIAGFDDTAALNKFAQDCDAVTLEFENIPIRAIDQIASVKPMRPSSRALEVAQDRVTEKEFVTQAGIQTAAYQPVDNAAELEAAFRDLGERIVVKTRRLGYDGKGQVWITHADEVADAWAALGGVPSIAEVAVNFTTEISVISARGADGVMATYVPVENRHVNGILDRTFAPAPIQRQVADRAVAIAETLAVELDIVGLLAVEMFVTGDNRLLVNEIAPRPHNSGHWTIDACAVDQFEQLVRAAAGWPLGDPSRHSDAEMHNLIGADVERWADLVSEPRACLHLYGKKEIRAGRKMGHVTYLADIA